MEWSDRYYTSDTMSGYAPYHERRIRTPERSEGCIPWRWTQQRCEQPSGGCAKIGVDVTIVAPKPLWTSESLWKRCDEYAKESGATIEITDDLDGVKGADVIYTDVWISMGEEKKEQERERLGKPYQVNAALMERTGKDTTIFSHCLPAIKEKEVTEEVFEGPQ